VRPYVPIFLRVTSFAVESFAVASLAIASFLASACFAGGGELSSGLLGLLRFAFRLSASAPLSDFFSIAILLPGQGKSVPCFLLCG
jgi:hypothetical protein